MQIFRYYSEAEHALAVLRDLEIRTSIPNTLNDPFELSPTIDAAQFTQRRLEAALRQDWKVDKLYQQEGRRFGFTSKKAYKRYYLKDLPQRVAKLLANVPKNAEAVRSGFANLFSKRWRLICASRARDSILMWSHYGKNHTGIVVEFDTDAPPFDHMAASVFPVTYSEHKPAYVQATKRSGFEDPMFTVASTKANQWSYEQEVRIIVPASPQVLRETRYLPIAAECVTTLILGCRAPGSTLVAARSVLKQRAFQQVGLLQGDLNRDEYRLNFKDCR